MRIGIYLSRPPEAVGGAATFEGNIVRALIKKANSIDWKVSCLATVAGSNEREDEINVGDLTCTVFHSAKKVELRPSRWNRFKVFQRNPLSTQKPVGDRISHWAVQRELDLIYSPSPFVPCNTIPFFTTVWDLQHRRQPFFPEVSVSGHKWQDREAMYMASLPRAAGIVTGTDVGKEEVIRFYGVADARVKVIPQATPDDAIQAAQLPLLPPLESFRYALYPAQFWPHKNHVTLLRAWSILKSRGRNIHLILTGTDHGNESYVRQTCSAYDLGDVVHFRGFVPREELLNLYRHAEMLVFPSLFGPDNIPPLEAMALRCPVIAANVPGATEQLQDATLLVDGTNEVHFADEVERVFSDEALANQLRNRGYQLAASRTVDRYADSLVEMFREFEVYRRTWTCRDHYFYP
jgi:glycosyltransferase involved in cell wall biosynthesis